MNITVESLVGGKTSPYDELFKKLGEKTFKLLNIEKEDSDVNVIFVDIETIHKLNLAFRGIDRPTDVISLEEVHEEDPNLKFFDKYQSFLGEIYICFEVADKNRKEYGNSIEREICFLFVHGLLHLLGYDHMKKEDEEIMFSLQDKIFDGEDLWNQTK